MGYETTIVSATKHNEKVELQGKEDFRQDRVMTKSMAASHPVLEYIGSVRLSSRHNATLGGFQCSKEFRAKSILLCSWHICQGLSCGYLRTNRVSKSSLVRLC